MKTFKLKKNVFGSIWNRTRYSIRNSIERRISIKRSIFDLIYSSVRISIKDSVWKLIHNNLQKEVNIESLK
jgi:hypothetical protein